jgi:SAM-dependent methyltransferase
MASFYRKRLEDWLKTIDVKADKVLDIGGSANPIEGRTRSWKVNQCEIMDNNGESKFHAEGDWAIPDIVFDLNLFHKSGTDLRMWLNDWYGFHKFDTVFCLEVFEYIWNPVQAIKNISRVCKSGGKAYISFPAIYPVHNPKEIDYLRYTKAGIEKLLEEARFSKWNITPRRASLGRDALGAFYSLEKMHPVKGDSVIFDIGYMVEAVK